MIKKQNGPKKPTCQRALIHKDVKKITADKIEDGKKEVSAYKFNNALSEITICDCLKDGYYLYFVFSGYTTSGFATEMASLFIFMITFTLLSFGRITYIINVKKSIKIMAQGNLSHRVPLKYKNELRELAENINHMASDLQKEDEKRKEFLTNVSHDLRTPLTSILGYLNMVKEETYEDEIKRFFERLYKKNKSRNQQGSGLGLSIVQEISKIHHGFIKGSIENEKIVFKLFILKNNC